eukprot:1516425-Rhodomonas_salina.1
MACGVFCLRACYAMSGTDLAHAAICLRARYAMSGTDVAYGATALLMPLLMAFLRLFSSRAAFEEVPSTAPALFAEVPRKCLAPYLMRYPEMPRDGFVTTLNAM